jgi:hypothetical protein
MKHHPALIALARPLTSRPASGASSGFRRDEAEIGLSEDGKGGDHDERAR